MSDLARDAISRDVYCLQSGNNSGKKIEKIECPVAKTQELTFTKIDISDI